MSIRLRLTLLYSAILALTLIGFSVLLYLTLRSSMIGVLDDRLADDAAQLVANKEFRLDRIDLPVDKFTARTAFIQTRNIAGIVTDRTDNLDDFSLPLSRDGLDAVRSGQPWYETTSINDARLRVYTQMVIFRDVPLGLVQVARSLEEQTESLRSLRGLLIIGSMIVTLGAFGIGWVLAGAALRPINRITQTAQAIGAERDFSRRVNYHAPHDEVGRLASTFNTMLTELQSAYRQVEQALQAQRRFVADASHELRTPLTTIRGNIGLLQRDPPIEVEDRIAALEDMHDETDRLIRLVNDLLVLARADAGQPWHNEPLPLKPLLEEVCRTARLLAPDRRLDCPEPPEVAVEGNRDALKQVLLILLDNALKYSPPSSQVGLAAQLHGDRVAISVRDAGSGIPAEALPHIFERFYRGTASRTGTGTGLGLAIARTLVEAQQGAITVESQYGQGSVFTVTLPLAPLPDDPDQTPVLLTLREKVAERSGP